MGKTGKRTRDPEIDRVMREYWPPYGAVRTRPELEVRGHRRSLSRVQGLAWELGLRRASWSPAEETILRAGIAVHDAAMGISQALAEAGYERNASDVAKRARELGIWDAAERERARAREWNRARTAESHELLVGGPYRALTRSTTWLIRRWHAEGDSAAYLASEMKRPLWFVMDVIARRDWRPRWEAERAARGLVEVSA